MFKHTENMLRLFGAVLLVATVAPAASAAVYRIVAPDGTVTYTDKPPAGTRAGSETTAGGSAPATAPAAASPAPKQAKSGSRAASAAPTQSMATGTAVSPELEGAVIGVLGIEDIAVRTEKLCVATLPTSFAKYSAALQRWRARNSAVVSRARQVLARNFDAATRTTIESGISLKNANMLAPVVGAAPAMRIQWCDKSMAAMEDGTMDVYKNPRLTGPLEQG